MLEHMTTYDFTNKTAIVTGSTRGIGRATAELLARSGANVIITGRKPETVTPAAEEIASTTGARVIGVPAHVAEPAAAEATCAKAIEEFGQLDILVNNAGTNPAFGPIIDQSAEIMSKVFEINTIGPAVWTGAAVRAGLGADGQGSVVNVASIGALTMEDHIGVYNASKAALLHLTRQLSRELAPKVRVNSISPGIVRTKLSEALWKEHEDFAASLTPLKRIGEPEDIAQAIAFLVSAENNWMTGENIVVDGGQLVGVPMKMGK